MYCINYLRVHDFIYYANVCELNGCNGFGTGNFTNHTQIVYTAANVTLNLNSTSGFKAEIETKILNTSLN